MRLEPFAGLLLAGCIGHATPADCVLDSDCAPQSICFVGSCRAGERTDGGLGACIHLEAKFSDINTSYLQVGCGTRTNVCHNSVSANGPTLYSSLDLSADAYKALVNVQAQNLIGRSADAGVLVAPGDPEHSFFLTKVRLTAFHDVAYGPGMPSDHPGSTCAPEQEAIRQWIAQGALRN